MLVVLDTNVAVVADGRAGQASSACRLVCIERLQRLTKGTDRLVIDSGRQVLDEYRANLDASAPGVGSAFLKWLYRNMSNPSACEQVAITPTKDGLSYEEFPNHSGLVAFDVSDRKFVAIAVAHSEKPPVLQAVDTDWWLARVALTESGVQTVFLCPTDIARLSA